MGRTPNGGRSGAGNANSPAQAAPDAGKAEQAPGGDTSPMATPTPPKDPRMFFDAPLIGGVQDRDSRERRPPRQGKG